MHTLPKSFLPMVLSVSLTALLVPAPALAEVAELEPAAEESADGGVVPAEGDALEAGADALGSGAVSEGSGSDEDLSGESSADSSEGTADGAEGFGVDEVALGAQADEASGTFNGMDWHLTSDGELILGKAGDEQTFSSGSWMYERDWPWYTSRSSIASVRVEGIVRASSSLEGMFYGCSRLTTLDLSGLDTFSVTDMDSMFYGCTSLTSLDLSCLETSSVTDMSRMFYACPRLSTLDLSGWNTSFVTDMSYMFSGCYALSFLDTTGWDTSSVTSMNGMFSDCSQLSFLDVSGWDTYVVTDMGGMFSGCSSLVSLDLSGWDTGAVSFAVGMFNTCSSLCQVRLGEGCTRLGTLPYPMVTNGKWRSEKTGAWYTSYEIDAQRLGVADTYTCSVDTKPAGGFVDVDASTPHLEDVLWLSAKGVSTGYDEPDGTKTFRGMDPVYRQDMAAFLYRLAGKPSYVPTQADMAKFRDVNWSTPHATEIWWLASAGISEGWDMGGGTFEFRGMDTVKRQDMAAFLRRLARRMGADADAPGAPNPFRDVNVSTAHYEDILWLASTGVTKGWDMGDGTFEYRGMNDVVRQDMAAFLHRLDNYVKRSVA